MKFTVVWSRTAEQRLARLWFDATDRDRIADAANEIDRILRLDPLSRNSEGREQGRRILLVPPLGVKYRIDAADRKVTVLYVWRFRTKQ